MSQQEEFDRKFAAAEFEKWAALIRDRLVNGPVTLTWTPGEGVDSSHHSIKPVAYVSCVVDLKEKL